MKSRNATNPFAPIARVALLAFAFGAMSCAPASRDIGTQDIAMRWMAVERSLAQARLAQASGETAPRGDGHCPVIQDLDEFHKLARSFLDSQAHLAYRAVAPAPDLGFPADGPPEIRELADLSLSLRQAVRDGDWDRAALVSSDISGSIAHAMAWGRTADQAVTRVYSQLLLAFGIVTAFAVLAMCLSFGMAARSQKREEEGADFSRAVLVAQEEERARISRELHDTVAQDMGRLSSKTRGIARAEEKAEREKLCAEVSALQSAIAGSLRDICSNLVPLDFGPQGLPDALRRLCADFAERAGIDCRMEAANCAGLEFPDKESSLQIFRIAQEALTNAEKHAKATEVIVKLRGEADGNIVIIIADNGAGLKPVSKKASSKGARMGIRGMSERAALLGGTLTVSGEPGEGTRVLLRLPAPRREQSAQIDSAAPATDVLLIDDHPLTNEGIAHSLKETGLFPECAQANTLDEARRFLKKADKLPSLIVLDIQLGRENGLNFLPFLKEHCHEKQIPAPPVLVCSAFDDPFRAQLALKLGASGYLPKSGNSREMLDAAQTVMRGGVYVPKEYADRLEKIFGRYAQFSSRELDVLNLVKQNKTNQQIAHEMNISKRTVERHMNSIYLKAGTSDREELIVL